MREIAEEKKIFVRTRENKVARGPAEKWGELGSRRG